MIIGKLIGEKKRRKPMENYIGTLGSSGTTASLPNVCSSPSLLCVGGILGRRFLRSDDDNDDEDDGDDDDNDDGDDNGNVR